VSSVEVAIETGASVGGGFTTTRASTGVSDGVGSASFISMSGASLISSFGNTGEAGCGVLDVGGGGGGILLRLAASVRLGERTSLKLIVVGDGVVSFDEQAECLDFLRSLRANEQPRCRRLATCSVLISSGTGIVCVDASE
jgi:hypothetical protein